MSAVVSVVSVSAVCDQVDQGDQVVPAHEVDDIDEVHEVQSGFHVKVTPCLGSPPSDLRVLGMFLQFLVTAVA